MILTKAEFFFEQVNIELGGIETMPLVILCIDLFWFYFKYQTNVMIFIDH
jgi:hypothetical protein